MKKSTIKKVDGTGSKYPGQQFSGSYEYCEVFPADKKLKVPVKYIKFEYPWDEIVCVKNCETWGDLFKKVYSNFRKLYKKDQREHGVNAEAWHCLEDYIVEQVDIYDDGMAEVLIGS